MNNTAKLNTLFGNTFISGIDVVVTIIYGFIIVPILLDKIGLVLFGVYSLLMLISVNGMLSMLDLGLEGALIKFLSEYNAKNDRKNFAAFFCNGIFLYVLIGIFLYILFYLTVNIFNWMPIKIGSSDFELSVQMVSVYIYQIPLQFYSLGICATLKSVQKFTSIKLLNIVFLASNLMIVIIYLTDKHIIISYLKIFNLLYLTKNILETFILIRFFRSSKISISKFEYNKIKKIYKYSKFLFISKIIGFIYNQTDKLLITVRMDISNLALYSIVIKIPSLIRALNSIINSTIIPYTSNLNALSEIEKIKMLFKFGTKFSNILILPIVVPMIFLAEEFLFHWVGKDYMFLNDLIIILLIQYFFSQLISFASTMIVGSGHVKDLIIYSLFGSIINLIVSIILMSKLGLYGLVVGTTFSYSMFTLPYLFKIVKIYNLNYQMVRNMIYRIFFTIAIMLLINFIIDKFIEFESIIFMFYCLSLLYMLNFILSYNIILNREEKIIVYNFFIYKLNNK